MMIYMVTIRCEDFSPLFWSYVSEIAKRKQISRCEALEEIVWEHMRFVEREYKRRTQERKKLDTKKKKA